jgi:signal transduction histidine kinase
MKRALRRLGGWVADRRSLLIGLAAGALALGATVRLAPGWTSGQISLGDLGYGALLAAAGLGLGLVLDFLRHRGLDQRLEALRLEGGETLEALLNRAVPAAGEPDRAGLGGRLDAALEALRQAERAERGAMDLERRKRDDDHASLIHEAKTPIAALSLALESRERQPELGEAESDFLRAVRGEVGRLELILERGLFASRAESFASDFLLEELDLRRLVTGVAARFAPAFLDGRLAFSLAPESARVLTDPKWLAFVLSQIFSNALKYLPPGGEVRASCRAEPSGVVLDIEDNGPGIAAEDLPRLFDRGFTGHARRSVHSTGMGLYLAARLCAQLGHELSASQVASGGARFSIRFPSA